MVAKKSLLCLFLLPALCLLSCSRQSVGTEEAVSESAEPYTILLVFTDPHCRYCKRDEPIIDGIRGKIDMIFLSWSDRDEIEYYKVRRVPLYILLTHDGHGKMPETWRTNSAADVRDRLGF